MQILFNKRTESFAEATVGQMAARRERRAAEQREFLSGGGEKRCVVCIGMNIAGPKKRSGLIDAAFIDAVRSFCAEIDAKCAIKAQKCAKFIDENTGIEALFALEADAKEIKRICVDIEENHPAGRLFDIDVIAKNGEKIGRSEPRKCLICSENAAVCARSRAHSVAELQRRTGELLSDFVSSFLADEAKKALVAEVNVTPKPGLVDRLNSGANSDMDALTFYKSAAALRPYFRRMAQLVIERFINDEAPGASEEFFDEIRKTGVEAERAMLFATGGVNTHRGAIYSLGLCVCAAAHEVCAGFFAPDESGLKGKFTEKPDFAQSCAKAAARFALALGDTGESASNGARVRERYGVSGPVQQAQAGFPLALLAKRAKAEYYNRYGQADDELAWAYALVSVMAELEDNNALHRGGRSGAELVKRRALELKGLALHAPAEAFYAALLEFDRELIKRNVSCGGSADMLALALFLDGIEAAYMKTFYMLTRRRTDNEE